MKVLLYLLIFFCSFNVKSQDFIIPFIPNFIADGTPGEWTSSLEPIHLHADHFGNTHHPDDLSALFYLGWNNSGLCFFIEVTDNCIYTDKFNPRLSDLVEIFISPGRKSDEILQLTILPDHGADNVPLLLDNDFRRNPLLRKQLPSNHFCFIRTENKYVLEGFIPFSLIGKNPVIGESFALQLYVTDKDSKNTGSKMLSWFPAGNTYINSLAMYTLETGENWNGPVSNAVKCWTINDSEVNIKILGFLPKDKIDVYYNKTLLYSRLNNDDIPNIIQANCTPEQIYSDTIWIYKNDKLYSFHPLLLCPYKFNNYLKNSRFEFEIRKFELFDKINFPLPGGTLFIGSSSIRNWHTIEYDFPEWNVLHRGFGGSTSSELKMYSDRIVSPYKPSKIMIYQGDNDIPRNMTPETVRNNVLNFIDEMHQKLPESNFYIISVKPSPARYNLWSSYSKLNFLLDELATTLDYVGFIDIATPMHDDNGNLRTDIFISDGIHMNDSGYQIWKNTIRKYFSLP